MNKELYDITDLYEAVKINDELKEENHNLCKELERYKNIVNELENFILNHYIVGHKVQNASLDDILNKLKELKGSDN